MSFSSFWHDEQGQDLIEYTLLLAFVTMGVAGLFIGSGKEVKGIWAVANNQIAIANGQMPS